MFSSAEAPSAFATPDGPPDGIPHGPLFRLRGPLRWREFDGQWVVMALPGGDLHQLDAVAAAVLGLIEAAPSSHQTLLSALNHASASAEASAPGAAPDQADSAVDELPQAPPQAPLQAPLPDPWPAALARALQHLQANDLVVAPPALRGLRA